MITRPDPVTAGVRINKLGPFVQDSQPGRATGGAATLATVLLTVRQFTAAALPIALGATMMWAGVLTLLVTTRASGQELNKELNEAIVKIPKKDFLFTVQLETTIYTPDGEGPFPVVVINHGKAIGNPRFQERYRPLFAVRYFMQRGYLVAVPMRQGFSKSTGNYIGAGCNVESNGRVQAEDVQAVLDYLVAQPHVDKDNILVMGQSHGGWTTLAFGALNYPGVKGLVNFAGGLKQDQCAGWEGTLARAAGSYGEETKLPSLWFYGDNDSFFDPYTFRRMHETYASNRGKATLVAFGNFGTDAHGMFGSRAGQAIWQPEVSKFMQRLGLPHQIVRQQYAVAPPMAAPPRTDFAALDKVEAVPYLKDKGREGYAIFLTRNFSRAFAIAPNGAWGFGSGGDDPLKRALDNCNKIGKGACRLYAVDDAVVWKE